MFTHGRLITLVVEGLWLAFESGLKHLWIHLDHFTVPTVVLGGGRGAGMGGGGGGGGVGGGGGMRGFWLLLCIVLDDVGKINPLHANFFRGNKKICLHFVSFLHTDMAQVVETLSRVRQGLTYAT